MNRSYYGTETSPSICEYRFRVVLGQENVTAETQKSFLAIALAARLSGQKNAAVRQPREHVSRRLCRSDCIDRALAAAGRTDFGPIVTLEQNPASAGAVSDQTMVVVT